MMREDLQISLKSAFTLFLFLGDLFFFSEPSKTLILKLDQNLGAGQGS